jgi:hypothetical protein
LAPLKTDARVQPADVPLPVDAPDSVIVDALAVALD